MREVSGHSLVTGQTQRLSTTDHKAHTMPYGVPYRYCELSITRATGYRVRVDSITEADNQITTSPKPCSSTTTPYASQYSQVSVCIIDCRLIASGPFASTSQSTAHLT